MTDRPPVFLLDSSAILTLLEDEDGAGRVQEVSRRGHTLVPALALMEVFYVLRQERGETDAYRSYAQSREMAGEVVWELDEPTLLLAGRLKADHRVSFADAWMAAIAQRRGAVLLHKDPEFEAVRNQVTLEALPYKGAAGEGTSTGPGAASED